MNLQLHLLSRIAAVAMLCLLVIATYSLYRSHRQAESNLRATAESLGKHLESQLLLSYAGIGRGEPFPNFEWWKQSGGQAGLCASYASAEDGASHSLCFGNSPGRTDWPAVFETIYRGLFAPGAPIKWAIAPQGAVRGWLTMTPSVEAEIADAWDTVSGLLALTAATVFSVCLLVFWMIRRALRPTRTIVAGLGELESGRLDFRLPEFELTEWHRIAAAINQLAASQQRLLAERQTWVLKSIDLQEQERRYLARELHDEFGQCLAAINAVAASIKHTAIRQCPDLVDETDRIAGITAHMLVGVRNLLGRLRPAEFDELGLAASLNSLVAGWSGRSGDKTRYRLEIIGDCARLTEEQALSLFRIVQECLTNIAKHACAANVGIRLVVDSVLAVLVVEDDGIAERLPFAATGIGLLGMHERVNALRGRMQLAIAEPRGLILEVRLPLAGS